MIHTKVKQNHYANHLSEINKTNTVIASKNICNMQGAILVAKGHPITAQIAKKIALHKLINPLDTSVSLIKVLDSKQLLERMMARWEKISLAPLVQKFGLLDDVKQQMEKLCSYEIILQKLTVFEKRFPDHFTRLLTSSCIALAIARELKLDEKTVSAVYIATLISDVGLLHIDPNVADKKGKYNAEEWHLYQGHVAISKTFADLVPGLPKSVGTAILQHHERNDGFGYPLKKKGEELCIEGRIIAKADTICAIYRKYVIAQNYPFSVLIPLLQINPAVNANPVNNATLRRLKILETHKRSDYKDEKILHLIPLLCRKVKFMDLWIKRSQALTNKHAKLLQNPIIADTMSMHSQLQQTLSTSGMISDMQIQWLRDVKENRREKDYQMVAQFSLMLHELEFQFEQFQRNMETLTPKLFGENSTIGQVNSEMNNLLRNSIDVK